MSKVKLVLFDNDVILKIAVYELANQVQQLWPNGTYSITVLFSARFVLALTIRRNSKSSNKERIAQSLQYLLSHFEEVEPTEQELQLAAAIEEEAMQRSLPLDSGESILASVLCHRDAESLITGDKRAISAIERLVSNFPKTRNAIACFEQLMLTIIGFSDLESLRKAVCTEACADRSMAICFCCHSEAVSSKTIRARCVYTEPYPEFLR